MLPPNLYARVHNSCCAIAHETAGAARTRSSLRPHVSMRANEDAKLGQTMSRERDAISTSLRAQRRNPCFSVRGEMDCFAALAMTWRGHGLCLVRRAKARSDVPTIDQRASRKMVGSPRLAHPTVAERLQVACTQWRGQLETCRRQDSRERLLLRAIGWTSILRTSDSPVLKA